MMAAISQFNFDEFQRFALHPLPPIFNLRPITGIIGHDPPEYPIQKWLRLSEQIYPKR